MFSVPLSFIFSPALLTNTLRILQGHSQDFFAEGGVQPMAHSSNFLVTVHAY